MKKILTKLFFITVILSAQILCALPSYSGGNGSVGTPFLISNATDLTTLASTVNGGTTYSGVYFQQTANIALSGSWTPIGALGLTFRGTYDGASHIVTGLTINDVLHDNQGLFGYVYGGTITNLGVVGVSIAGGGYVGGLVGVAGPGCNISNCYSTGSVSGSKTSGIVGGLIGTGYNFNIISNCYSTATVSIGNDVQDAGGFMGHIFNDALPGSCNLSNCYSTGSVTGEAVDVHLGGFLGSVDPSSGAVSISNCFWDQTTSGMTYGVGKGTTPYGYDITGVTGETTANMQSTSTYTGWDITGTVWRINGGYPFLAWQDPSGGTPMPVELTSFTSAVSKNGVTLKWSTATEVNNYGFNVERRAVNSTSSWAKIGFVAGHGTSNSTIVYSYTDAGLASGSYAYRLKQIDNGGAFKYSQSIQLEVSLTPTVIGLSQNYPNPFNPTTLITFSVANTENAKLVVYNILGQPVVTLFEGVAIGQQIYQLRLDASKLSTGVYFYKLETPSRTDVRRMQLLK
jgi:hypothetical protein